MGDFASLASSVSVRSFVRFGSYISVQDNVKVSSVLAFNSGTTYFKYDSTSATLMSYVGGVKAMTIEDDGGILHGSWSAQVEITTSDRRLKKDIAPLQRTLRNIIPVTEVGKQQQLLANKGDRQLADGSDSKDGALWLLRQLRPVSYSFRKGIESKYMRFGFIADELESVVPQVVRTMRNSEVEDQKAVIYQDLIALLAAAAQSQQARIEGQQARIEGQEQRIDSLQKILEELLVIVKERKGTKEDGKKKKLRLGSRRRRHN